MDPEPEEVKDDSENHHQTEKRKIMVIGSEKEGKLSLIQDIFKEAEDSLPSPDKDKSGNNPIDLNK